MLMVMLLLLMSLIMWWMMTIMMMMMMVMMMMTGRMRITGITRRRTRKMMLILRFAPLPCSYLLLKLKEGGLYFSVPDSVHGS